MACVVCVARRARGEKSEARGKGRERARARAALRFGTPRSKKAVWVVVRQMGRVGVAGGKWLVRKICGGPGSARNAGSVLVCVCGGGWGGHGAAGGVIRCGGVLQRGFFLCVYVCGDRISHTRTVDTSGVSVAREGERKLEERWDRKKVSRFLGRSEKKKRKESDMSACISGRAPRRRRRAKGGSV